MQHNFSNSCSRLWPAPLTVRGASGTVSRHVWEVAPETWREANSHITFPHWPLLAPKWPEYLDVEHWNGTLQIVTKQAGAVLAILLLQETWNPEQNFTLRPRTLQCAMRTFLIVVHRLMDRKPKFKLTVCMIVFSFCISTKFIFKQRNSKIISDKFRKPGNLQCNGICMCVYTNIYI